MFADPSRGFAPAPQWGALGTVIAGPSRGFAPAPPHGTLYLNFDPNLGSANNVPRLHAGGVGAKYLLGSGNTSELG